MTATSLYSQDSYPEKISLNGDTLIAITPQQLVSINSMLDDRLTLKLYGDSLVSIVDMQLTSIERQIALNRLLNKRNTELLVENSDLFKLKQENEKLVDYLKREIRVKNRKKTGTFFLGVTIGVASASTAILILTR